MIRLLSGDEAVALAASEAQVALGTGYPGTPSTEILEEFAALGGRAQWAPNEKVALEVGVGVAFAGARAIVTMKHVGLNVAADPFFTVAYTGVPGGLVVVSADDPGMASSQNEQDNRRYAVAAGVPILLEPADSQEAYDYTLLGLEISERWQAPVLLRLTTRVCHSKTIVKTGRAVPAPRMAHFVRDIPGRVMIPAYARPAHRRLRAKLDEMARWNEAEGPRRTHAGGTALGILTAGIAYQHAREAAPEASVLKLGMTHPLPVEAMRRFAAGVERCVVIEEGDPYLEEAARAAGIAVEARAGRFRFGELDVARVRRILARDDSEEPPPPKGKPPALCPSCPHRVVFDALRNLDAIVAGDIGCYSLGVLPPFEAMDTLVCMGAGITVGLGLRHALPEEEARRVVSVIGDSTFVHSGITGLVEMIYNPPATGHVVLILDNGTTAMTGLQEHPGTGRALDHRHTGKVVFEQLARTLGIERVHVIDPTLSAGAFERLVKECLDSRELAVVIARRNCLLAAGAIREYEKCDVASDCASAPSRSRLGSAFRATTVREWSGASANSNGAVFSIVIAGLGGQGVLKASDIVADVAFRAGRDVKKSEVHGMSQRGGSVASDVRFGEEVFSPMTPPGEADFLVVLEPDQVAVNRGALRPGGVLIEPAAVEAGKLRNRKSLNVALLGALSRHLEFPEALWVAAIEAALPEKLHEANRQAFALGRQA